MARKSYTDSRTYKPYYAGVDIATTGKEAFAAFCKEYPDFRRYYNIHDYNIIVGKLNEYYMDYMIETANMVVLPHGLGKMVVRKFRKPIRMKRNKTLNQKVNYLLTKKLKKTVYYTNDHTDGNSFMWMWIKNKKMSTWGMWRMKFLEGTRRKLAKYLLNGGDWEKFHNLTDATREYLIKRRIKREQEALKNAGN